jgi:hypothetical protein
VLADLTDGDFQELGVPLGDRRRLLRAIAELSDRGQPRLPHPNRSCSWIPPNDGRSQ